MYENMTFENIMDRCLARVSSSVDKREGSIIYDAISPSAAELAILYIELAYLLDRAFPDTATGEDLTKKCRERGVFRTDAKFAVRKGYFEKADGSGCDVPIGNHLSGGDINFVVTERIAAGQYKLTAETAGAVGNEYIGTLFPIEEVADLAAARLADILIPGEDEESDASLLARYNASLVSQAFGGNIADYKGKIELLQGVGAVKVFPTFRGGHRPADLNPPSGASAWIDGLSGPEDCLAWIRRVFAMINEGVVTVGGGTVQVRFVDSEWTVPSAVLVQSVQTQVDPTANQGEGMGTAPIGHAVNVQGATGATIDVSFTLAFDTGVTWSGVQGDVKAAIQTYFDELVHTWADVDSLVVRISQIETKILNVAGIIDITGTRINGGTANISLASDTIPVLGVVTNGT